MPVSGLVLLALLLVGAPAILDSSGASAHEARRVTVCVVVHSEPGSTRSVPESVVPVLLSHTLSYRGPCADYGPPRDLGNGRIRTFAQISGDRPVAIGVSFSTATLTGLPTEMTDRQRCFDVDGSGTIEEMAECVGGHERALELPAALTRLAGVPFAWALVNWNPHGHGPPMVYNRPHLDFHFYLQPKAERDAIRLGPCGLVVNCDDFARGLVPVPAHYLPADYSDNGAVEGLMGNHLVDLTNDEWHGRPFEKTFIYGAYDGRITFLEPMITKSWLDRLPDDPAAGGCYPIKQPSAWQVAGWYPRVYCTRFRPNRDEYLVTLEDFTMDAAVIGTWTTTVQANGRPPSELVLALRRDRTIDLTGPAGPDGEPLYVGTGRWDSLSDGRFSFDVTHPLPDGSGGLLGTIRGHQDGTVAGDRFSTSGHAYLDKPDGTTVGPNPVTMTGIRAGSHDR